MAKPVLVVEGKADIKFLMDCAQTAFGVELSREDFIDVGTDWRGLENNRTQFERRANEGRALLMILDADWDTPNHEQGGFAKRNAAIGHWLQQNGVAAKVFIWPNHNDNGTLETMLQHITLPAHAAIFQCFEQYEQCLRASDDEYVTPNEKAKIYSYVEALGVKGDNKGEAKRNYQDVSLWDLNSAYLNPLKQFLAPHLANV